MMMDNLYSQKDPFIGRRLERAACAVGDGFWPLMCK